MRREEESLEKSLAYKMEKNHLHLLTKHQFDWCNRHVKEEWWVNSSGEVKVHKYLTLKDTKKIQKFEVQFADLRGNFDCSHCTSLTSLKGAPRKVEGFFDCSGCHSLTSLEGAPQEVGKFFNCSDCPSLTSLKGSPQKVGEFYTCVNCKNLTSLEGAPREIDGGFSCNHCTSLTSLKGAPQKVDGIFSCTFCRSLVSLEGAPVEVGNKFDCRYCTSLDSFSVALAEDQELLKKWLKSNPRPSPEKFLHDKRGMIHGKKFGV